MCFRAINLFAPPSSRSRTKNKTPVLHPSADAGLAAVNPPPPLCLDRSALRVPSHVLTPCTPDGGASLSACQSHRRRLASAPAGEGGSASDGGNDEAFDEQAISLWLRRRPLADHRSPHVRRPTHTHTHAHTPHCPIPPLSTRTLKRA